MKIQSSKFPFHSETSKIQSYGFTLLEVLVSAGIVAIILAGASASLISILTSRNKTEIQVNIKQTGEYALQSLHREFTHALDVDQAVSCNGSQLASIDIIDEYNQPITAVCDVDGNDITLDGESLLLSTVSDINYDLQSCTFSCNNNNRTYQRYSIDIQFRLYDTANEQSYDFTSQTVLRN